MLRKIITNFSSKTIRETTKQHFKLVTTACASNEKVVPVSERIRDRSAPFPSYTTEESGKILDIVNNKSLDELLSYGVSKARANKLHAWKNRHGPLQDVQDILLVEGFGLKIVEKFCRSLLEEPVTKAAPPKAQRARTAPFIIPSLDVDHQPLIRSCVSLRIGVSSVSWARLELSPDEVPNSPCLLTHWEHHDIIEKKMHLNDLVQRCLYLDHLIPDADSYLFESPQTAQVNNNPGNADQQNISIQKAQITAVLSYSLCARGRRHVGASTDVESKKGHQQNIFYLRRFLTARLFNHLIGTERVSSENTILNLMRTYYNTEDQQDFLQDHSTNAESLDPNDPSARLSFRGNVQFPYHLREMFSRAERYHREFLGQALLLNLAFVRLILLQDPESISVVSRNSNKNKTEVEE